MATLSPLAASAWPPQPFGQWGSASQAAMPGRFPAQSAPVSAGMGFYASRQAGAAPYPIAYAPMASPIAGIPAREPEILAALTVLAETRNLPQDEAYLRNLGVNIVFQNGKQALDVIRKWGARVEFGDTGDPNAHAVWIKEENRILINQRYRGQMDRFTLYAIAAAIYHEAGHATLLSDNRSSIQEEIDCLALNTMAYRSHVAKDPQYAYASTTGPLKALFDNGVALYPKLFFDPDPFKRALVNRIIEKYGMLAPDSPDHPIPKLPYGTPLAIRVLHEIQRRYAQQVAGQ